MNEKTKVILLSVAALLVFVWGLGMSEGNKKGGYSDETNYFSKAEIEAREKTIAQMAEMRGETPPPAATPKPTKQPKEKTLPEPYASIPMQDVTDKSFSLNKLGYDKDSGILVAEYNMTGLIYAYSDVPEEEYVKLMESEDFDKWFEFMITKKFEFRQLN